MSFSVFLWDMFCWVLEMFKWELFILDYEGCEDILEFLVGSVRIGERMWFGEENGEDIVMVDEMMEVMEIFMFLLVVVFVIIVWIFELYLFVFLVLSLFF